MNAIIKKLILLCAIIFIIGCNSRKNENSIIFVSLHNNVLYDTIGKPYLHIKQYAEYKFSNKDSLLIGTSENNNNYYYDNNFKIDNKKPFHFGLGKFYTIKIDRDFSELMKKILDMKYEKSYAINQNGKLKIFFYFDEYRLPDELKSADSMIRNQINLSTQVIDKPNYSVKAILDLQDSLFRRLPPPKVVFEPPIIEENEQQ